MKKKIIVSVINDLVTDQRVSRTCHELEKMGYEVLLVGRKLKHSMPMPELPYRHHRIKFLFTKGALFYAFYNWRLMWFLLFKKTDILWSNDLDTILANFIVSRIRHKPLVFDSHEYFTEVPELEHNQFAKTVWKNLERFMVPRLHYCITVNESIAGLFKNDYGKDFYVIRNVPVRHKIVKTTGRKELGMPENKKIIILQGSGINMHRGAEELVQSFALLPEDFHLYIVGSGDVLDILKKMAAELQLEERVHFIGKQPYQLLVQYTMNADAGVTLDKDTNINYRYSLPNKIFDYIQCGIPVISSDLAELKKIVLGWEVGTIVPEVSPASIADSIQQLFSDPGKLELLKANTHKAALELHWDREKKVLEDLMRKVEENPKLI